MKQPKSKRRPKACLLFRAAATRQKQQASLGPLWASVRVDGIVMLNGEWFRPASRLGRRRYSVMLRGAWAARPPTPMGKGWIAAGPAADESDHVHEQCLAYKQFFFHCVDLTPYSTIFNCINFQQYCFLINTVQHLLVIIYTRYSIPHGVTGHGTASLV